MESNLEAIIAAAVERTAARVRREFESVRSVPKEFGDTSEAANYTGVNKDYLEKLRRIGGGPKFYRRAARVVRYRFRDLDAWMEAGEIGGGD